MKKRVADLEDQNREMLRLLRDLQARLDKPAAAPVAPAPAAAANVVAAPPAPAPAAHPLQWNDLVEDGSHFRLYGMLRLDMDFDTQRPNNAQTPLYISSPSAGEGGSFSMHPRLTRLGLDLTGPRLSALGDADLSGKLETDFENGGSESRQLIRIRHAYLQAKWGSFALLGGQTWDVFSPLFPTVNNDTLMWNAGNVGDRRPQMRASWQPKAGKGQFSFEGAMGLSGAVDPLDLDGNGYRDGEQSMRPNVQSRIGYARSLWVRGQAFSVGASVFQGWLNVARPIGGRTSLASEGYNIDYTLPLARSVTLRGEGWWGRNMSDFRGGAGQSITPLNGRMVRGRGGWSELKIRFSRYWSVAPGFTTDNPVSADLAAGSRTRNRAFYFGNRFTPGGRFEIGLDYLRWLTDYRGLLSGIDNRVNLFVQYGF